MNTAALLYQLLLVQELHSLGTWHFDKAGSLLGESAAKPCFCREPRGKWCFQQERGCGCGPAGWHLCSGACGETCLRLRVMDEVMFPRNPAEAPAIIMGTEFPLYSSLLQGGRKPSSEVGWVGWLVLITENSEGRSGQLTWCGRS